MIYELFGMIIVWAGSILLTLIILGILIYWAYNQWLIRVLNWKAEISRKEFFKLVNIHRNNLKKVMKK